MMIGAFVVRLPAEGWQPEGWTPPTEEETGDLQTTADVSANSAIRTPQFWLLWTVLFCNVTAGIGMLEQASPDGPGLLLCLDRPRRRASSGCCRWRTWLGG